MRPAGNLAGVEFIHPPRYHNQTDEWKLIISNSGYFFTREAMRFFSSAVSWDSLTSVGHKYLFVTSGSAWDGQKRYSLNEWNLETGVDTIGEFGEYDTLKAARAAIKQLTSN